MAQSALPRSSSQGFAYSCNPRESERNRPATAPWDTAGNQGGNMNNRQMQQTWQVHTREFEQSARRLRSEALAQEIAAFGAMLDSAMTRVKRAMAQQRTATALSRLSDRALADIGLRRDQIEFAARS